MYIKANGVCFAQLLCLVHVTGAQNVWVGSAAFIRMGTLHNETFDSEMGTTIIDKQ